MASVDSKVAKMLLDAGLLDQFQYRSVRDQQERSGDRFHLVVMELGFVPEDRVVDVVAKATGISQVSLAKMQPDPKAVAKLDGAFCSRHTVFPCALRDGGKSLWLSMADPTDGDAAREARRQSGVNIRTLAGRPSEIREHIQRFYGDELEDADPFSAAAIDLSLNDAEAEEEQEFKVTDLSGKTLVEHSGQARQEGSASAKLAARLAAEHPDAPMAAGGPVLRVDAQPPPLTIEQRMERIDRNQQKAARIIKALVNLFIEKGFFAAGEFTQHRKK